jgi:hypothetical protein
MSLMALTVSGCVLNPKAEFDYWNVESALGKSFSKRTENYCPPLSEEATDRGTVVYSYRYQCQKPNSDCTIFYEVAEDTIIAAWHKGSDCRKVN